jgi:hypothetical protein
MGLPYDIFAVGLGEGVDTTFELGLADGFVVGEADGEGE